MSKNKLQPQSDDKNDINQLEEKYKKTKPKSQTSKKYPLEDQNGQINRGKGPKNLKR